MIAYDDPVVCNVLSAQVAHHYEIVGVAENAGKAVELATEHHPDVALIDIDMPGGGGLEAVRRIGRLTRDLPGHPVGRRELRSRRRATARGCRPLSAQGRRGDKGLADP
jgi:CheY-like chemotaxis protein